MPHLDTEPTSIDPALEARLRALQQWTLRPAVAAAQEAQLRQQFTQKYAPHRRWFTPQWRLAFRLSRALVLIGFTAFSLMWGVLAARTSLPGEWLYPAKRAIEDAQLALAPTATHAAMHADFGQERTRELVTLIGQGSNDTALLENIALDISAATEAALEDIAATPAPARAQVLRRIMTYLQAQQQLVGSAQALAPLETSAVLNVALQELRINEMLTQRQLSQLPDGRLLIWPQF